MSSGSIACSQRNNERGGHRCPLKNNLQSACSAVSGIIHGPSFSNEPPRLVEFSNNTGAKIECTATGDPTPKVTWSLSDGTSVTNIASLRQVHADGTLVFPPFSASDFRQDIHAAVYRCVASNAVGVVVSGDVQVKAEITLLVKSNLNTTRSSLVISRYWLLLVQFEKSRKRTPLDISSLNNLIWWDYVAFAGFSAKSIRSMLSEPGVLAQIFVKGGRGFLTDGKKSPFCWVLEHSAVPKGAR
uniref:Ig-like domain-containing protein n=1 Tax=Strigamia maritima TaxID=126957 RepID=T1JNW8_STRMM